jgi:hypothetical protein
VNPAPSVTLGNDTIVCADDHITLNAGTGFSSYQWSNGSSLSSIVVDSSGTGIGNKEVFVSVMNSYGCSNSDTMTIKFDLCAGIASNDGKFNGVKIYPNPFTKAFSVSCKERCVITVYDVAGKTIQREENVTGEFVFGERLSSGTYYVQLNAGGEKKVYKVVKY